MKKITIAAIAVILSAALLTCVGSAPANKTGSTTPQTAANKADYFTGDGGKGKSITILPPRGVGLAANQAYLPDFVANELVSNFGGFSAMTLFDRVSNDKQYNELLSGIYDDNDAAGLDLGHLSSTDYMLLGDITKTSTGYALQLTVNRNSDKTTVATFSGAVSVAELDNLAAVRRASLDLLQKMGVQVTERGRAELTGAATAEIVKAQTAMAQGIVAQRGGNEFEAMSNYFKARTFSPALPEAATRTVSAVTAFAATPAANNSANTGGGLRGQMLSEIQQMQQKLEEERLAKEREANRVKNVQELIKQATPFYKAHQPFTVLMRDTFTYGTPNVYSKTVPIGVALYVVPSDDEFKIIRELSQQSRGIEGYELWPFIMWKRYDETKYDKNYNEVIKKGKPYQEKWAKGRQGFWNYILVSEIDNIGHQGHSKDKGVDFDLSFTVVAEIANSDGKVLAKVTFECNPLEDMYDPWEDINFRGPMIKEFKTDDFFRQAANRGVSVDAKSCNVPVNDITDTLTARIVSVNGQDISRVISSGSVGIERVTTVLTSVKR